jgi:hypothetical protein
MIAGNPWLILAEQDAEAAFRRHFRTVCNDLWLYADLVEEIADRLNEAGTLSARVVAALCREYARREMETAAPSAGR